MNLRELKIFLVVAETGSMSEAGRRLFITQPAVSQTIAELEDEIKLKLFERLNRKLILTYGGEVLLEYAQRILNLVDEAGHTLDELANLQRGRLRIGASMTIGTYLLPEIISSFNGDYQEIELSLLIDNTEVIEQKILGNKIDLGLVEGPIHSAEIGTRFYFDEPLCLITAREHPWAETGEIDPAEIASEDFIIREKGSGTREVIEKIMTRYQIDYRVKHILNNIEAIKKAVIANIGISILPEIAVRQELTSGLIRDIKIKNLTLNRKINIVYHRDKFHSNIFIKFLEHLLNWQL